MFNRLGKFSAFRTVLLSPLPLKINIHKACFLSFPCITLFRIQHMINLTALEKTLEDIIFFSSFSYIYHLNSRVFFFFKCLPLISDLEFTTLFKVTVESHVESPAGLFSPTLALLHSISTQEIKLSFENANQIIKLYGSKYPNCFPSYSGQKKKKVIHKDVPVQCDMLMFRPQNDFFSSHTDNPDEIFWVFAVSVPST